MPSAYIFDFDGVLARTMDAHYECYRRALAEAGVPIDRKQFYSQAGMTGREQIRYFAERSGAPADPDAIYRRKKEIWAEGGHNVRAIECNVELLRLLRRSGVCVAIASGSSASTIRPIMADLHIEADALAAAEDVQRGKPHPDLFLLAAERLGVPPADCTVIEDSDVGVESAQAAGMRVMRFFDNSAAV